MIYTVTFNPAIDYVVHLDTLTQGGVNRTDSEEIYFGGKGINVSKVLSELGVPSKALGFTAGFTGEAIEKGVAAMGVDADFVRLKHGNSRINVKLKTGCETEINGQGADIDSESLNTLLTKLDGLKSGDTLILAGSIPKSLPESIYEDILHRLDGKGIRTVVDASKRLLLNVLPYSPYLIKPNDQELGELFGVTIESAEQAVEYAEKLQEKGARNVLVSRAAAGSVLVTEEGERYCCGVYSGEVRNSVGAGDSMLAGFVAGLESGGYEYALRLGTACGGATAFSSGLASRSEVFYLLDNCPLEVDKMSEK